MNKNLHKAQRAYNKSRAKLRELMKKEFPPGTIVQPNLWYRDNCKPRAEVIGPSPLYSDCVALKGSGALGTHVSWWSLEKVEIQSEEHEEAAI